MSGWSEGNVVFIENYYLALGATCIDFVLTT
jgi:hypothetical protein